MESEKENDFDGREEWIRTILMIALATNTKSIYSC